VVQMQMQKGVLDGSGLENTTTSRGFRPSGLVTGGSVPTGIHAPFSSLVP